MIYAAKNKVIDARFGDKKVLKMMLGDVNMYTTEFPVTCDLENVTSDAPFTVLYGNSLSVTLSGTGSNKVQENSVVVMMGGVDITSTAYDHSTKTITIANVTGNISIAAVGRPYDAEVEYLQGDGSAYIDTGINTKYNIMMEAGIRIESSSANIIDICGARSSTSSNQNAVLFYYANGFLYRFNTTNKYASSAKSLGDYTIKTTTYSDRSTLYVSGAATGNAEITQRASFSTSIHYLIFNFSNNGTPQTPAGAGLKIKYFKLYDGSTLVRDFIPVKDNNIGYLYDKVSGQLYGNANSSGAFTYGNDV